MPEVAHFHKVLDYNENNELPKLLLREGGWQPLIYERFSKTIENLWKNVEKGVFLVFGAKDGDGAGLIHEKLFDVWFRNGLKCPIHVLKFHTRNFHTFNCAGIYHAFERPRPRIARLHWADCFDSF